MKSNLKFQNEDYLFPYYFKKDLSQLIRYIRIKKKEVTKLDKEKMREENKMKTQYHINHMPPGLTHLPGKHHILDSESPTTARSKSPQDNLTQANQKSEETQPFLVPRPGKNITT